MPHSVFGSAQSCFCSCFDLQS